MKTMLPAAFALVSIVSFGAVAEEGAPAAYQPCIACHGATGEGSEPLAAPALAGQDAQYLARQLRNFKSGVRGSDPADIQGARMRGMTAALSDADIPLVSEFLSRLPAPKVWPAEGADMMNGNNYYQSKCGACHGGKAQGNPSLNAPALANLDAAYLTRQFENFQRGLRGSHADDKYGRQMKMMSTVLPEAKDLADVIAFVHAQGQGE